MALLKDLTLSHMTTFLKNNPTATMDSNGFSREDYCNELSRRPDGRAWLDAEWNKVENVNKSRTYGVDGEGRASGPRVGHQR